MKGFVIALGLVLAPASEQPTPETLVAAEHAFAAAVAEKGFKQGFLAFAAPDGFMFNPVPTNARKILETVPDGPPEKTPLAWWPDFAGIARSGELGFTSGPASSPVRYFTVWKKQPDGSWRWIYDGGAPMSAPLPYQADAKPRLLPLASAAAGSAERAAAEIAPLEARIAAGSTDDARGALKTMLAKQALLGVPGKPSRTGDDPDAALAGRPAAMSLRGLGQTASTAGDMVFSWGEARWATDRQLRWGHYARIWQKDSAYGWRVVADVLIPAPGAPPAGS